MIQKSSLPVKTIEKIDNSGCEQNLISMDSQLSFYLWQITQLNFVKQTNSVCDSLNTGLNLTAMNHYKKRWRDKYVTPHSNHHSKDPLRLINNMVNDSRTYIHVWSYQRLLSLIIEDETPNNAQNIIEKYANTNYLKQFLFTNNK